MTAATAEQIRNRPIAVTIPGTDLQIELCRPDPLTLIANNVLPLEVFASVLDVVAQWTQEGEGPSPLEAARKAPQLWGQFIDRWVCAASVSPQVVLDEAAALADPTKLWIDEIDLPVKLEILRLTNTRFRSPRLGDAVKEFRRLRPEGAGAGSDGEAVRRETVGAAEDLGPGAGA